MIVTYKLTCIAHLPLRRLVIHKGKVPGHLVHDRHAKRVKRRNFVYSVRFRTGPLGISFDNQVPLKPPPPPTDI